NTAMCCSRVFFLAIGADYGTGQTWEGSLHLSAPLECSTYDQPRRSRSPCWRSARELRDGRTFAWLYVWRSRPFCLTDILAFGRTIERLPTGHRIDGGRAAVDPPSPW